MSYCIKQIVPCALYFQGGLKRAAKSIFQFSRPFLWYNVGKPEGVANQNPEQKARDLIDRKLFGDKADVLQEGLKAALAA